MSTTEPDTAADDRMLAALIEAAPEAVREKLRAALATEEGAPTPEVTSEVPRAYPTIAATGVTPVRSFGSAAAAPIPFDVTGELFYAVPDAPAGVMIDMAKLQGASKSERLNALGAFLDGVLLPDSAARIAARMRDTSNPIGLEALTELVTWLVEEVYTPGTPTGGPSPSS